MQATPNHRGKHRLARFVDWLVADFATTLSDGSRLRLIASSQMDMSWVLANNDDHGPTQRLLQMLQPGWTFVDVGANAGRFVVPAAKRVGCGGRVFAIEPSAREFTRLLWAIDANDVRNVIPLNVALGQGTRVASFAVARGHTGLSRLDRAPAEQHDFAPTACLSGDSILPALITGPTVIKIDVEGAEYLVIEGLLNALSSLDIRALLAEVTPRFLAHFGATAEMLYRALAAQGFRPTVGMKDAWQYDELWIRETD